MLKNIMNTLLVWLCAQPLVFGFEAAWFDELTPLYPDSKVSEGKQRFTVHTPATAPAGAHLLVSGLPSGASLTLPSMKDASWARLLDVPVEENTGVDSRTEIFKGKKNPHVIRRAPFRVYEVIQPIQGRIVRADASGRLALRLSVKGLESRVLDCSLHAEGKRIELQLDYHVHKVNLPTVAKQNFHYTNWFSLKNMGKIQGCKVWSDEWWKVLDRYAAMMAYGRQNTVRIPLSSMVSLDNSGNPQLNQARFERYTRLFTKHGFHFFEGGHLARRKGGSWGTTELETTLGNYKVSSEQGKKVITSICRQFFEEIKRHGWQKQWYQHISDEPNDKMANSYKSVAKLVHKAMPGVMIMDASMTRSLEGAIDVWCPQIQKFQTHRKFFEARQAAGDQIWTYVCLAPGGPWLNRLLDQERLRPVYFGWAAEHYQVDGFLHWGLNRYQNDPFQQSVVTHPCGNPKNKLPAGDTHILYPGKNGPLSSVRFEAHRIGMEDQAMLAMLRKKNPAQMDEVIARVFRAYNDFNISVEVYRNTRLKLMRLIK